MEPWVPFAITVLVALIAASGGWLTLASTRRVQREARADKLRARNIKLINYAQHLRDHIYRGDPAPPEDWPDDLYD